MTEGVIPVSYTHLCVPAEALLQYTVPRDEFLKNTLTLKPGMVYNREALVARLFAAGYVPVSYTHLDVYKRQLTH